MQPSHFLIVLLPIHLCLVVKKKRYDLAFCSLQVLEVAFRELALRKLLLAHRQIFTLVAPLTLFEYLLFLKLRHVLLPHIATLVAMDLLFEHTCEDRLMVACDYCGRLERVEA